MPSDFDQLLGQLRVTPPEASSPGVVQSQDNTPREHSHITPSGAEQYSGVDSLFGDSTAYCQIRKEKPEHRLMLWHKLRGHSNREVAALTGYTEPHVSHITRQPWFREAFCKLSSEMGKDSVQTFLEGTVMESLQGVLALAQSADSEAVKLAAHKDLLDRFLGKAVVKTESKVDLTSVTAVVDAEKLMRENMELEKELRTRGISTGIN